MSKGKLFILSGCSGVGKSTVTTMLAVAMQKMGFKAAVLDADITGPSIPKAFGLKNVEVYGDDNGMIPPSSKTGIDMMSVNLLLGDDETKPVILRGAMIAGTVQQFWKDTIWNADVLLVDCPPGTGDVPLTVFQSLPLDGIVIVSSPQDLVAMIVKKAANMADMMKIPVLGLVENMSYFTCPKCSEKHEIFGESQAESLAKRFEIDNVVRLPINPDFARTIDAGAAENLIIPDFESFTSKITD